VAITPHLERPGRTGRTTERRGVTAAVGRVVASDGAGAAVLLAATAVALVWANSPWRAAYGRVWTHNARQAVDEGLMTLFFLAVGLEIKRELVEGALRHWRTAALPAIAAGGGMAVPALLYLALNARGPGARGWAVPMATDIAFAVGILALLGSRVPPGLKLFLLTLAVVDDVGAVVVIAVFYTPAVHLVPLLAAGALLAVTAAVGRCRLSSLPVFAVLGLGMWLAVFQSGVHATLAGVALGLLAPTGAGTAAVRAEHALAPVVRFLVLPVFALANAGVTLGARSLHGPGAASVAAGVVVGLVLGKLVGVTGAAWLAVRAGIGRLPEGVRWPQLVGVAAVAGIGFTVSVFVADLGFADPRLQAAAKLGVLAASGASAAVGAAILIATTRSARPVAADRSQADQPH